jgi:hypothetical protein
MLPAQDLSALPETHVAAWAALYEVGAARQEYDNVKYSNLAERYSSYDYREAAENAYVDLTRKLDNLSTSPARVRYGPL